MNEQTELIASIKALAADLAVAYSSLRASVCAMQIAEARVLEARVELATAKNTVLINHADDIKALGTNEAVREANISKLVEKERTAFSDTEADYTSCRNAHQLAQLEVEAFRDQLRCMESTALIIGGRDGR